MKTRMITKALLFALPVTCMQYGHASSQIPMRNNYKYKNGYTKSYINVGKNDQSAKSTITNKKANTKNDNDQTQNKKANTKNDNDQTQIDSKNQNIINKDTNGTDVQNELLEEKKEDQELQIKRYITKMFMSKYSDDIDLDALIDETSIKDVMLAMLAKYIVSPDSLKSKYGKIYAKDLFLQSPKHWFECMFAYMILSEREPNYLDELLGEKLGEKFDKKASSRDKLDKLISQLSENSEFDPTAQQSFDEANNLIQQVIDNQNVKNLINDKELSILPKLARNILKKADKRQDEGKSYLETFFPINKDTKLVCTTKMGSGDVEGKIIKSEGQVLCKMCSVPTSDAATAKLIEKAESAQKILSTKIQTREIQAEETFKSEDLEIKGKLFDIKIPSKFDWQIMWLEALNSMQSILAMMSHSPTFVNLAIEITNESNSKQKDRLGTIVAELIMNFNPNDNNWCTKLAYLYMNWIAAQIQNLSGISDLSSLLLTHLFKALPDKKLQKDISSYRKKGGSISSVFPVNSDDTYEDIQTKLSGSNVNVGKVLLLNLPQEQDFSGNFKKIMFPPYLEIAGTSYVLTGTIAPGKPHDGKSKLVKENYPIIQPLESGEIKMLTAEMPENYERCTGVLAMYERADALGLLEYDAEECKKALQPEEPGHNMINLNNQI